MSEDNENDGEWDEKSDLTRIEDLSEFLHVEDDELNQKFEDIDTPLNADNEQAQGEDLLALNDLEDDPDSEENPPPFGNFNSTDEEDEDDQQSENFYESESANQFGSDSSEFDESTEPNLQVEELSEDFSLEEQTNTQDDEVDESEDDQFSINTEEDEDNEINSFEEAPGFESSEDNEEASFLTTDENEDDEEQWSDDPNTSFSSQNTDSELDSDEGEGDIFESSFDDQENDIEDAEESSKSYEDIAEEPFELPDPEDLEINRQALAQELDHTPPEVTGFEKESSSPLSITTRENFQDLRDFGNSISYGLVQTGGNPPYSLIVRQLKFEEDARDILIILREHGLVSSENEETISQGLEQGSLLISQISEYSAIYLAHRLRRFDLDLRIGLSDQLHPSKSYNPDNKGLVSKHNLAQNFQEDVILEDRVVHIEDIIMVTTPTVEEYSIYKYLDILTSHTIIKEDELKRISSAAAEVDEESEDLSFQSPTYEDHKDSDPDLMNNYSLGLNEIYQELSIELKNQAFKIEANAVVGINFALTPMIDSGDSKGNTTYKITCSGNAVWIVDKQG